MKNLIPLLFILAISACKKDKQYETTQYFTASDFTAAILKPSNQVMLVNNSSRDVVIWEVAVSSFQQTESNSYGYLYSLPPKDTLIVSGDSLINLRTNPSTSFNATTDSTFIQACFILYDKQEFQYNGSATHNVNGNLTLYEPSFTACN